MRKDRKLSAELQLKVCALAAIGYNAQRITDILKEENGITVNRFGIYQNYITYPRYKKIITRMNREAEHKILKHPLALKLNRLQILRDAINEALTWRLDKINYDKDGRELSRIEKRNIGVIANLINEARREIEGDKPFIDQSTHITYNVMAEKMKEARSRRDAILNPTRS